jgi:hypothetical protein
MPTIRSAASAPARAELHASPMHSHAIGTIQQISSLLRHEDAEAFLDRGRLRLALVGADAPTRLHHARSVLRNRERLHHEVTAPYDGAGLRLRQIMSAISAANELEDTPAAQTEAVVIAFAPASETADSADDELGAAMALALRAKDVVMLADRMDDIPDAMRIEINFALRIPATALARRRAHAHLLIADGGFALPEAIAALRTGAPVGDLLRIRAFHGPLAPEAEAAALAALREARGDPIPKLAAIDLRLFNLQEAGEPRAAAQLAAELAKAAHAPWSADLTGLPGTGKSAFGRKVAHLAGMEAMVIRMSEILGPYVSNNERNLTRAFRDARSRDAVMIFDEGEDVSADRGAADTDWQSRMTNALITNLDEHTRPVMFTSNFGDRMDPAVSSRSTVSIEFLALPIDRFALAWETLVGRPCPVAPRDDAVPRDFVKIRRQETMFGPLPESRINAILAREAARREKAFPVARRIGF